MTAAGRWTEKPGQKKKEEEQGRFLTVKINQAAERNAKGKCSAVVRALD